ncbi:DDE-type integrase/transposase/recombinase [Haliangium sp.]|uniref:DDE-type integrase/transposase/recombinase n=1 Tax=Haliangium sp. TaxID=2663208 RepID=UPI003D0AC2AF
MLPTPEDRAEEIALFRSEIVGALVRRELTRGELQRELTALSQVRFRPPGSGHTRTYALPTLQRWYYAYRAGGLAALRPRPRRDRGHGRKLPEELRTLLCQIRREHPSTPTSLIVRTLVADGRIDRDAVSVATVRRLYRERGLDRHTPAAGTRVRLRWQAERPNALWHGDVCHGAALRGPDGSSRPLRIHALLDDATRYLVALQAFTSEREDDMLALLVGALRRHGAPQAMYLDNGPTYRGTALRVVCERLGTTLVHAQPYDPAARGKMERFWRTLRLGCLNQMGELNDLDAVNARLAAFRDQHYHLAPHAGLLGKTPGQVWYERAAERLVDSLDEAALQDAFTVRARRRVRTDSTLDVAGATWEIDAGFLAGRVVTVSRSLAAPEAAPWVEHEGKRLVLHRVAPERNARRKRARRPTPPPPTTPFDPAGALLALGQSSHDQEDDA